MATASRPATDRVSRTAPVLRRPVYDPVGQVHGYELQVHAAPTPSTPLGDDATTVTLLDVFSRFRAVDLFGGRPGIVTLTRAFVLGRLPMPLPPEAALIQVPTGTRVDADLLDGAAQLARAGYRLAVEHRPGLAWQALLPHLAAVVVDVQARDWDEVEAVADAARERQLIARGVGSAVQLNRCAEAGFELFQGEWLERVGGVDVDSLSPSQAVALDLVGRLSDPETSMEEVETLVRRSPELCFRLLRVANSASSGQREVGSLRDAIVMVGAARLRSWLLLLSLSSSPAAEKPLMDALTQAGMCERLARSGGAASPGSAFTVGLLHGVAQVLQVPVPDLLSQLPALAGELADALRGEPGPLRAVLEDVVAYQSGQVAREAEAELVEAYLGALVWTTQTVAATT